MGSTHTPHSLHLLPITLIPPPTQERMKGKLQDGLLACKEPTAGLCEALSQTIPLAAELQHSGTTPQVPAVGAVDATGPRAGLPKVCTEETIKIQPGDHTL